MGGEGIEVNPRTASSNIVIEGNVIHDAGYATCNDGGLRSCRPAISLNINQSGSVDDVIIRNNLMWDLSSGCVWEKSGSTGASSPQIYNNTCYDYGKGTVTNDQPMGISSHLYGSTALVKNNIIYASNGTDPIEGGSFAADHNLCKSAGSCGASAQAWSATTVLSIAQNDVNFLKAGSTGMAKSTGTNLFSAGVTIDYVGLDRTSTGPFDIGAFIAGTPGAVPAAPTHLRVVR